VFVGQGTVALNMLKSLGSTVSPQPAKMSAAAQSDTTTVKDIYLQLPEDFDVKSVNGKSPARPNVCMRNSMVDQPVALASDSTQQLSQLAANVFVLLPCHHMSVYIHAVYQHSAQSRLNW
jgi:hypothetical protein